mgnify:CR=1 FL=1
MSKTCPHGYPLDDPDAEPCYREGCYTPKPDDGKRECDVCGEMDYPCSCVVGGPVVWWMNEREELECE